LLEESKARVRMLVAPAGYGKTTLAEQWVARDGHEGVWLTARRSSQDVAALALGLASAASALIEGCDTRLREHLRAVPTPAENVETLAEILGEDLETWPAHGWLVIDDYQEIAGASDAERLVAALVKASPAQLLIATRQRPSWVTTRGLLYGDVLELNQIALAMDAAEAAEVLGAESAGSASGLVALANGWPAVIGLASVSSADLAGDGEQVPESLYRFFAEEVYASLGGEVQDGLARLALAPVLDRELAEALLESDADVVCQAALDVGILVEHGSVLELHPLARSFLEERSAELGFEGDPTSVARCIDHYCRRRDWDGAFEVIARHRLTEQLDALLLSALDELLETARLSTIETWCLLASDLELETPAVALARAEVALRQGRHAVAQAHAEVAARSEGSTLRFRALVVAGRAAHLASREEDALELYRLAEAAAANENERRDALWGQVMCSIELERPDAVAALEALRADTSFSQPRDVVRAAAYTLSAQLKLGSLDLAQADVAVELLATVEDPLVASAFRNVHAAALALSARYDDALEATRCLLEIVARYRLEFVVPYALSVESVARAGRREWPGAHRALDRAAAAAQVHRNSYAEQVCFATRLRILAQEGRLDLALDLPLPELRNALPAARSEVLGSRALVLVSAGRLDEARALIDDIRGGSSAIEPAVLVAAVDALVSLKRRSETAVEDVGEFVVRAFSTGALDLLVTAYRSTPELLAMLLRHPERERVISVLRRVRDEDLAEALGQSVRVTDDPRAKLTAREREVFELLRAGFTNRQIAKLLFIEESTAKVHTQHIYDKLGTRSRTALAIQAALERADQATRATGNADSADES
jgi:LuxR family transcriptional regulator, maltose regulon positive regulatory protein